MLNFNIIQVLKVNFFHQFLCIGTLIMCIKFRENRVKPHKHLTKVWRTHIHRPAVPYDIISFALSSRQAKIKTGPLWLIWQTLTNAQHLLIIFGKEDLIHFSIDSSKVLQQLGISCMV